MTAVHATVVDLARAWERGDPDVRALEAAVARAAEGDQRACVIDSLVVVAARLAERGLPEASRGLVELSHRLLTARAAATEARRAESRADRFGRFVTARRAPARALGRPTVEARALSSFAPLRRRA